MAFWAPRTPSSPNCASPREAEGALDALRATVCENLELYMNKNEEEFRPYLQDFAATVHAKVWYGVPGSAAVKLEETMRKHLPDLFEEQPDLLHELVTQLSPSTLKAEGVPVYRAFQNPGEFILTFPRAYHSGFNCGFNCAEAVNVAPVDWLPHGQCAAELYSEQHRKTSISHDKLLFATAKEAIKELRENTHLSKGNPRSARWQNFCGKNGILTEAIKARVTMEHQRRDNISGILEVRNMKTDFDLSTERECFLCFYDLHLSAIVCECSPNRYACLSHANALCTCESRRKFVLTRYDLAKLDALVAALEGNLSALKLCDLEEDVFELPESSSVPEKSKDHASEPHRSLINVNVTDVDYNAYNDDNAKEACKGHPQLDMNDSCVLFKQHEQVYDINDPCISGCLGDDYAPTGRQFECSKSSSAGKCTNSRDPAAKDVEKLDIDMHHNEIKCEGSSSSGKVIMLLNNNKCKNQLLCSDLNSTPTSLELKVETENFDDRVDYAKAAMTCINGHEDHQADSHVSGKTQIELEVMRKDDKLTGASCDCGSSGSQSLSADLVFSSDCPDNNVNVGTCSRSSVCTRKTSPKLFGVELQQGPSTPPTLDDSIHSNIFDQSVHGTRMAQSIPKYSIEPLNFGKVMQGEMWCDRQAIFPKGFRSRVRFLSVLEPTKICSYISEVIDAGFMGPLFKVTVEDKPDVSFVNSSALQCWDMVRQKLNQEIARLKSYGNQGLPPLPSLDSIDGLEMFGFRSPPIIHVIEAMDPYHVCLAYWSSKLNPSLTGVHVKVESPRSDGNSGGDIGPSSCQKKRKLFGVDLIKKDKAPNELDDVASVIRGLFQKANLEELRMMQKIFSSENGSSNWKTAYSTLLDEIQKNVHKK